MRNVRSQIPSGDGRSEGVDGVREEDLDNEDLINQIDTKTHFSWCLASYYKCNRL